MAAVVLLLTMVVEVGLSTRQQSPSWDEGDHIYAGYMNWINGEYTLNPEHPPLVKLVATLPLVPLDLKTAPRQGRYFKDEAYFGGRELIFRNDPKYRRQVQLRHAASSSSPGRADVWHCACSSLFFAGKEMFGATAGLITMALLRVRSLDIGQRAVCHHGYGRGLRLFRNGLFVLSIREADDLEASGYLRTSARAGSGFEALDDRAVSVADDSGSGRASRQMEDIRQTSDSRRQRKSAIGLGIIGAMALFVLWGIYSFRFHMHPNGVTHGSAERGGASAGRRRCNGSSCSARIITCCRRATCSDWWMCRAWAKRGRHISWARSTRTASGITSPLFWR